MLRVPVATIEGAHKALVDILGHQGMLQAVGNNPGLLKVSGDKIQLTAAAVKGLLGDSHGTNLLKEKPRLLCAGGPYTEANFEILCGAFDHDIVVKAPATTIEGALKALVDILGHQGMLQAVGNHPGLLRAPGDKIHLTAAAVKGLLGDSHGTNLLKEKPRLLRASGPHTEANFKSCAVHSITTLW